MLERHPVGRGRLAARARTNSSPFETEGVVAEQREEKMAVAVMVGGEVVCTVKAVVRWEREAVAVMARVMEVRADRVAGAEASLAVVVRVAMVG